MRPKNETAAVNVLLRKNRENRFGAYPIIIQVTKDRKTFIKSLGYDALEDEWDIDNTGQYLDELFQGKKRVQIKCKSSDRFLSLHLSNEIPYEGSTTMQSRYRSK